MDATAVRLQRICAEHGREITPARAQSVTDAMRESFGVGFSAAGLEWDEDCILDRMEAMLESGELQAFPEVGG